MYHCTVAFFYVLKWILILASVTDNVAFQPAEMSNEELENMLENLENETLNQEGAQSLASSHELTPESEGKSSENLGARPKEFHNSHSRIFRCFFEQMYHLKKKINIFWQGH